jgi:glyoxylase-like metal-dependent hydrolase (beta-lactamase superfamily II)
MFFFLVAAPYFAAAGASLPAHVRLLTGPVNGLLVDDRVLVYGDPTGRVGARAGRLLLLTEARRDVAWAAVRPAGQHGTTVIAPEGERALLENPGAFWAGYETARFHDYTQVNTKVLREALPVGRVVKGGDIVDAGGGLKIEVIDTPGYTRGAVSYAFTIGGRRIVCTGDLIYGEGQLFDLSSLQDAVPEVGLRGYHGYAARAGVLIASLRKIAAMKADVLVPARGPVIADNPQRSIELLIGRLQGLMASHFATDALRWYFGPESLRKRSGTAMDNRPVDSMAMAEPRPLPEWAVALGNARLLISKSGGAFLIDSGYKALEGKIETLKTAGRLNRVEGIWITHYHDDHTDYAQAMASNYGVPVYFARSLAGVLEHPGDYRLPCLTTAGITSGRPQADGARMRWHEFQFTFFEFPGQTLYHDGLLVERDGGGEALFFTGDSFTPSGIDDYCLQNRNLVGPEQGFQYCLRVIERLPANVWLVNQHVEPTWRFSAAQYERMRAELGKRAAILKELGPWPDANYMVDESWAAISPYRVETPGDGGSPVTLRLQIRNHAARAETYRVGWNVPAGWRVVEAQSEVAIPAEGEGAATARIMPAGGPGLYVVSADVSFAGQVLREWSEALVRVKRR